MCTCVSVKQKRLGRAAVQNHHATHRFKKNQSDGGGQASDRENTKKACEGGNFFRKQLHILIE